MIEFTKHQLAGHVLVVNRPVFIVVEKVWFIENGQCGPNRECVSGRDVAVDVAGVPLRVLLGLLEAELDDELEEFVLRPKSARNVGSADAGDMQVKEHEQGRQDNETYTGRR